MENLDQERRELNVGDLSELVILSVLDVLGSAQIPTILESLELATRDAKAPFFVGPSLENVLQWHEGLRQVQEVGTGGTKTYRITREGKETVQHYQELLRDLFPSIDRLRGGGAIAAR